MCESPSNARVRANKKNPEKNLNSSLCLAKGSLMWNNIHREEKREKSSRSYDDAQFFRVLFFGALKINAELIYTSHECV